MSGGQGSRGGGGHAPRPGQPSQGGGGPSRGGYQNAPPQTLLTAEEVGHIFDENGYLTVNTLGQRLGKALIDGEASQSQVRNILNSFQAIAETWEATALTEWGRQIARLKPNLIYLAARETAQRKKTMLQGLAETLGFAIDHTLAAGTPEEMRERFTTVVDLVEALTAYHRVGARA